MPPTEVPTKETPGPESPQLDGKTSRYQYYETHELLAVIDELEDDRRWARLREGIWLSLLAHIFLFSLVTWGPRYLLHIPRVVNPSDVLKDRKDLTYLDLPPDALKELKPKHTDVISDKNRIAQSKSPTLDKKTLAELQAMKKAGPPAPAPEQQQQQQQAVPPQQAQQAPQPQQQQTQPLQNNQQAMLDAPRPSPVPARPNFATGPQNPGDQIRQAARAAAQSPGYPGGDYGANAPQDHTGLKSGVEVLSDTMGVDFGPYINSVIRETYRTWEPLIPESVRPPLLKSGTVAIEFVILPDGSVQPRSMALRQRSGDIAMDRAAWGAIQGSDYRPLPKEFKGPYLALRFYFLYNPKPGQEY